MLKCKDDKQVNTRGYVDCKL